VPSQQVSVILPAKNEAGSIGKLIEEISQLLPAAQILVVNDGSTDATAELASNAGATVLSHPYSKGNGAAIKTGARAATGEVLVFMDADGQHSPRDIEHLLDAIESGHDLAVGARSSSSQATFGRLVANKIYNRLASWMVGHSVKDLTSGFRAVRAEKFREFIALLPNGFSYPTTSTMAFFRAGYSVSFVPIEVSRRVGKSHINHLRDGVRFFLIIFKIGTLYSPLKVYFPAAVLTGGLGVVNYLITFSMGGARFTNMSTMLLLGGVIIFLMGLLSEQLTNLQYKDTDIDPDVKID
jgi:glycosyltransferase involved in cell wall biosynthesis